MHRRHGFTLIEIITVTIIIGVLTAIAIPQYYRVKGRSYVATMQSDLRNLVAAEEMYFSEHGRYTAAVADLQNFRATTGVTIDISSAGLGGWHAIARHTASTEACAISIGNVAPAGAAEGVPSCGAAATTGSAPGERQP